METRANYLLVGGFVIAFTVGLLLFVVWLAKFQFDTSFIRYDIFFQGSVTGLREGSAVRYSGVGVGEVVFVGLDRDDPSRVRALVEIEATTPVKEDTIASLEIEGLTGGRYILLSGGSAASPPLIASEDQKRPAIRSKPSTLETVIEGAPELLQSATFALLQLNDLLKPENRESVASILANLDRLSGVLAGRSDDIDSLISNANAAMGNLNGVTASLDELTSSLTADSARLAARADNTLSAVETLARSVTASVDATEEDVKGLVVELRDSARAFTAMANELRTLVAENREPLNAFATNGLYELTTLLTEARDLLGGLNRVTTEVGRDPARFLFGNQQQGYEAKE